MKEYSIRNILLKVDRNANPTRDKKKYLTFPANRMELLAIDHC